MCTLTAIYGQNAMNDIHKATSNGAILNILVTDAPLWFSVCYLNLSFFFHFLEIYSFYHFANLTNQSKENLLPAQIKHILTKKPLIKHIGDSIVQLLQITDLTKLQNQLISSGALRSLCQSAFTEFDSEDDWIKFSDILQLCLPESINSKVIIDAVQSISKQDNVSEESLSSVSCIIEYLASCASKQVTDPNIFNLLLNSINCNNKK